MSNNMEDKIYCIKDLFKYYERGKNLIKAIDGINLDIHKGSFIIITGPSGSGKTTLLNMLSGLDKPSSGSILLNGRELTGMNEHELCSVKRFDIGVIFQFFYLHEGLTAIQNVEYPMIIAGKKNKLRKRRAADLIENVGLTGRKDFYPRELSGGEKQRLGVARALANDPSVIIADEPTGNLDIISTKEIMSILWRLVIDDNKTVVMVTHDMEILTPRNVIVNLTDGKLEL